MPKCVLNERARPVVIADKMLYSLPVAAPSTSASRAHAHGGEREPSDVHQYPPPDLHAEVDAFSKNVPDMRITKADRMQTRGIVQALMYTRASPR